MGPRFWPAADGREKSSAAIIVPFAVPRGHVDLENREFSNINQINEFAINKKNKHRFFSVQNAVFLARKSNMKPCAQRWRK